MGPWKFVYPEIRDQELAEDTVSVIITIIEGVEN